MTTIVSSNHTLSFGALKRILDGETLNDVILQILGHKQIPGSNNTRFRLLLNDGVILFPYAILASPLNNLIHDNQLEKYTVFKLKNYAFNQLIASKKVIICTEIEIIVPGCDVNGKINVGNGNVSDEITNLNDSISMSMTNVLSPTDVHSGPNSSGFAQNWDTARSNTVVTNYANETNVHPGPSTSGFAQNWDTARSNTVVTNLANETNAHPGPSTSGFVQNWEAARSNAVVTNHANETNGHLSPISSLSPYRRKWTIKARVSYKTPYIKYNNLHEQGKYFSFHLLDNSGEIRATAFNKNAERIYDMLEIFKIYFISNADVKRAPENSCIKNDFDIIIENYTKIEPFKGIISTIPMPIFKFQTIRQIISLPKDSSTDVIGICHQVSDVSVIMTKSNKEISKRIISLIDNFKKPITITLWDAHAENFPLAGNHVVAIKNAVVSDYRGFSLNTSFKSMIYIDPNIDKTYELKSWFQTNSVTLSSVSPRKSLREASQNWKTIAEVFNEVNNSVNTPMYYTLKATIVMVKKEKCLYQACSVPGCSKKVIDLNNGRYRCEKCNINNDIFNWSLCLFFEVADFSGSYWVTAFKETAELLIEMSCDQLNEIRNENKDKYYDVLNSLNLRTYAFKMRSHIETINNDKYIKTVALNIAPLNPDHFSKLLLVNIKKIHRLLNVTH